MKKCPNCNSKKYHGNSFMKKCENCGFEWKNPSYHKFAFTYGSHYGAEKTQNIVRNSEKFGQIEYHNIAYKFPIICDNPQLSLPEIIPMKNWNKEQLKTKQVTIQRTPKSIIIFLNRRITKDVKDINKAISEAETVIRSEAQAFSKKYNIVLGEPEPLKKEMKLIPPFLPAGVKFEGKIAKSVYNDGTIEFTDKDKAGEHTKNFVENMALVNKVDGINQKLDKLNGALNTFAVGMEQHMILISELQNTARSMDKAVNNITPLYLKIWKKIRSWFK